MHNAGRLCVVTTATVVLVFVGGASPIPAWSEQPGPDGRGSSSTTAPGRPADLGSPGIVGGRLLLTTG